MERISKYFIFPIILFLLITSNPSSIRAQDSHGNIINLNNSSYKDFTFDDLINKYRGKILYIDFWASWCKPCLKEMPHIKELQDYFAKENFVIIFISNERNIDAWQYKIQELKINSDHYHANPDIWNEIKSILNLSSIPRYVLINKKGKIVDKDAIEPSNQDLIKKIKSML